MNKIQRSESFHLAIILAVIGGYLDTYTYFCRDRVFANAQTGNIVQLGITLVNGQYKETLKYLIPIVAFSLGVLLSLYLKNKQINFLHWRQLVLIFESIIVVVVSFIPINYDLNIIANILVSFLCAMQAESFKKVLGKPFSSTMCTGNLRTGVECIYYATKNKDRKTLISAIQYLLIILFFIIGAFLGALISTKLLEKSILILLIPLLMSIFIMFEIEGKYSQN